MRYSPREDLDKLDKLDDVQRAIVLRYCSGKGFRVAGAPFEVPRSRAKALCLPFRSLMVYWAWKRKKDPLKWTIDRALAELDGRIPSL